jgi:hypothetical protein
MNNLQLKAESRRTRQGFIKMLVSLFDGDQMVEQTMMGLDDFISLLQNSQRRGDVPKPVFIPDIPEGYVDGMVTGKDGCLGAIIRLEPQKHQFLLAGTEKDAEGAYFIPLPGIVYECVANKGNVFTFRCYCYKEWEGDQTELFYYPFGNVSSSGHICMGSIRRGAIKDFRDIMELIESSLNGMTNSDYLNGDLCRLSTKTTQHDFCKMLQQSGEFPLEQLLSAGKTVADLKKDFRNVSNTLR